VKRHIRSIALYGAETWTLQEVDQEYLDSFLNVVLEKDGDSWIDHGKNEEVLQGQQGKEHSTDNKTKQG
jgi:hypothetical protein